MRGSFERSSEAPRPTTVLVFLRITESANQWAHHEFATRELTDLHVETGPGEYAAHQVPSLRLAQDHLGAAWLRPTRLR